MLTLTVPNAPILCAVSGGADSMALLHLLRTARESGAIPAVFAAHYNHGLRETAARDEALVREACGAWDIPLLTQAGDVRAYAAANHLGLEEAARVLRYAFLEQAAAHFKAEWIATAHHADDNLETLLLNLVRGAGLDGLCGIPPVRGQVLRPLLEYTRAELLAYAAACCLPFAHDESNDDTQYRRNFIRHEIVPLLESLNPALSQAAGRLARSLRQDADLLNTQAQEALARLQEEALLQGGEDALCTKSLPALPAALSARVLRLYCQDWGFVPEEKHVTAMLALCGNPSPHASLSLPGGLVFQKQYHWIQLRREPTPAKPCFSLRLTEIPCFSANIYNSFNTFTVASDTIVGTVCVRTRQSGDKLRLPHRNGSKTVKKWFIEQKIPLVRRETLAVVTDDAGIIAVQGLGVDASRMPKPGQGALLLEVIQN